MVLVREEEITHGLKGQGARQCAAAAFVAQAQRQRFQALGGFGIAAVQRQHGARQRGHLRGNFPQLGQGDGLGRVCQRFAQGGDQARLVVFGELLHVHAQRLADFEQHGHGERALVLLDLVQVAGRDAQRVRQGCLRQAALGAQTAQLQAHEGFFHGPDDAPCGAAEIRNIRKRPGIFTQPFAISVLLQRGCFA